MVAYCGLALCMTVWIVFNRKAARPKQTTDIAFYVAYFMPVGTVLLAGLRSDWISWIWHLYWTMPSLAVIGCLFAQTIVKPESDRKTKVPTFVLLLPLAIASVFVLIPEMAVGRSTVLRDFIGIEATANRMQSFVNQHPGRYAMGDRAGLTAYILGLPIVQLEGLIGDHQVIAFINDQRDLQSVLHHYDVDYLIVSRSTPFVKSKGGYEVQIPDADQAGPRSKKLKTAFLLAPLYVDSTTKLGIHTAIFGRDQR